MPCSCFGKKDKKTAGAAEKYSSPEQEPLCAQAPAPAPTLTAVPAQTEPAPAAPPTPVTPTSGDTRLRPEDDPDQASRRRDVVASFYSDQCELIGFKATGSRPPSAVGGGGGRGDEPAATSSPLGSPTRSSAMSRADLAKKRREFFKDLAVNDLNSSRYGSSEPTWRMVDSGSLTTPRRPYQHDNHHHHHTLPLQARYGGLILRPVNSPAKGTSQPDLHFTNGNTQAEQLTDHSTVREGGVGSPVEAVTNRPEAGLEEPLLTHQHSGGDQSESAVPVTPPVTPETPPPTLPPGAEPVSVIVPSLHESAPPDSPLGDGVTDSISSTLVVQQQYVQQVSVQSDDERRAEGSSILIEEAFPEEPRSPPHTNAHHVPDTTATVSSSPSPPPSPASATHQAAQDVPQHSSEQPAITPPPCQRRCSLPEEAGERDELSRLTSEATLDTDQNSRPTSSPDTSAPGSPQEPRQMPLEVTAAAASPQQQHLPPGDPLATQQEAVDTHEAARLSPTIVDCIPKEASTLEADPRPPSPPTTPTETHPSPPPTRPSQEETRPASPPSPLNRHDPPPTLSQPLVTCGVEVSSSSQLEDDGLGSDIDDALGSLECLTEEGNSKKRATAST